MRDVQRERGEVAIEGVGTLELDVAEREPMHRIDVRELNRGAAVAGAAAAALGVSLSARRRRDARRSPST